MTLNFTYISAKGKASQASNRSITAYNHSATQEITKISIPQDIPVCAPICNRVLNEKAQTKLQMRHTKANIGANTEHQPIQWIAVQPEGQDECMAFPVYNNTKYGCCQKISLSDLSNYDPPKLILHSSHAKNMVKQTFQSMKKIHSKGLLEFNRSSNFKFSRTTGLIKY
jgi:hypothetical protein